MEINCLKFSGKLMSYLKTINSVLQNLTISYNCLNKPDFIVILGHLKHLKHLTVFAAVGTEKNILEDISDSKCQLQSFKFGQTQNSKELDKNAILKFLRTQNKEITSLDMTDWTRNLHFDDKIEVFAYLQNCKNLKNLKVIIIQVGSIRKCAPALSSDFVNKQYLK